MRSLYLLLLAACRPPDLVSPCGTQFLYDDRQVVRSPKASDRPEDQVLWTGEELARAETRTITAFSPVFPVNICQRLGRVTVFQEQEPVWMEGGRSMAGYAVCPGATIYIGTGPFIHSAYAHEVAHLLQGCYAPLPVDPLLDEDHADWYRDGIYAAIDRAQSE